MGSISKVEGEIFIGKTFHLNEECSYFYVNCKFINCKFYGSNDVTNFFSCYFNNCKVEDPMVYRKLIEYGWENKWSKCRLMNLYHRIRFFIGLTSS